MDERREPSRPPSDAHPALSGARALLDAEDRPARVQLVAALLFGLVLVASGLYLWRRPHADPDSAGSDPAVGSSDGPGASSGSAGLGALLPTGAGDGGTVLPGSAAVAGGSPAVSLSDARVLICQDRGRKKTAPDQCDHVAPLEQALASAVSNAGSCATSSSGTIEYVADVSFARHKVSISLPSAGRSVRDRKTLRACSAAVRGAMKAVALDGVDHQHSRYKIAVTATYKGS